MTFALLAHDPGTGGLGGVAATGDLCVGGWVLRADPRGGVTASQGLAPSTLWGQDALARLVAGATPRATVDDVVEHDRGRDARQLAVLDVHGATAAFDGAGNHDFTGHMTGPGWIAAGTWLTGPAVLEAAGAAFDAADGLLSERLLAAVEAGVAAGGDRRGTLSAALLCVAADEPPLDLRVDWDTDPVGRLIALHDRTRTPDYRAWLATLPTRKEPHKA